MRNLPILKNGIVRLIQPEINLELISNYASLLNEPRIMKGTGSLEKISNKEAAILLMQWRQDPLKMHWFIQLNEKGFWTSVGDVNLDYMTKLDKETQEFSNLGINFFENSSEIKIVISEKYQERGIGRLALDSAIRYGLQKRNIDRIYSFIYEDNNASLNLFKKIGFTKVGFLIGTKNGKKEEIFKLGKII
jgi:RimJ/RimL family protein N-acetyltransferase